MYFCIFYVSFILSYNFIYSNNLFSFVFSFFFFFLFLLLFFLLSFGGFLLGYLQSQEEDIAVHEPDVQQVGRLVDALSALCCKAEQDRLAHSLDFLHSRYNEVQDLCSRKGALLGQALSNARLFGEDEVEVLNWLAEVEDKLSSVSVKDYKLEVLQKQHTDQMVHHFKFIFCFFLCCFFFC